MSLLIIFIAPTFIVDKGIYQRSNINGLALSFFYFLSSATDLRDGSSLASNQLTQTPDALYLNRSKSFIRSLCSCHKPSNH